MSSDVNAYISEQRELLDRLEAFSRLPDFQVLSQAGREVFNEPSDHELARWLLEPIYGLDKRPIDLVGEPDGLAQVVNRLHRIFHGKGLDVLGTAVASLNEVRPRALTHPVREAMCRCAPWCPLEDCALARSTCGSCYLGD